MKRVVTRTPSLYAALDRVEAAASPEWLAAAREVGLLIIGRGEEFTTDAVWQELERREVKPPREPRALGVVMRAFARDGLIVDTGRVEKTSRDVAHKRPSTVWQPVRQRRRVIRTRAKEDSAP